MIIDLNYRVDILKGIVSQNAEHPLYYDDQNAHRVNVSLYRGQEEINLSGLSCNGYVVFVKEGASIGPLTGEVSNNTCSVVLPHEAYQHPGAIRVEIKLIEGDSVTTVLMLTGHVSSGRGDRVIDITGSIVPSLDSLKATIEELERRIAAIEVSEVVELERKVVRHDTAQSLTNAQQKQARENIGAVGTDEMSAEFLCQMLFGNDDDWSVENYGSASFSATKAGRIITYKGNNNSNSGFVSVNLTGVPGAPHTARTGNFNNIALADTDFVPIPKWLQYVDTNNSGRFCLLSYSHADRYNEDVHTGYAVDYVLRRYNTETAEYEYTTRTTTPLGPINTSTTANDVNKVSMAQIVPDFRGGDYVVDWSEWEEMAIFAIRRNRMFSGTVLLTPTYVPYGDQKPVVYSAEQTLEFGEQRQARMNIDALPRAALTGANVIAGKHPRLALECRNAANNSVTSIGNGEMLTLNGTASSGFVISLLGDYPLGTSSSTRPGESSLEKGPFDVVPGHTYLMRFRLVSGSYTGANPRIALYDTDGAEISGMSCDIPTGEKTFVMDDRTQIGQYGAFFYKNSVYNNATFTMEWVDITDNASNLAPQDTTKAGNQHAAGDLLTVGGTLYKATQAILAGDTINSTNVEDTTVAAQLAERDTAISELREGVVRHDTAQSMTDAQKAQARANAGAASQNAMTIISRGHGENLIALTDFTEVFGGGTSYTVDTENQTITVTSTSGTYRCLQTPVNWVQNHLTPGHTYRLHAKAAKVSGRPEARASFRGGENGVDIVNYDASIIYPDPNNGGDAFVDYTVDRFTRRITLFVSFGRAYAASVVFSDIWLVDVTDARNLAPVDNPTATATHASGSLLTVSGQLYKATQAIAPGDTISTKAQATTVAEQLAERDTAISAVEADAEYIYMEPWQLVAKKYFLPDSTGNLTVRRNHITYRPSGSTSAPNVRSLIGAYEGSSTTLGGYTPTIDQLIPVSVFGNAIKIGFYLDAVGTTDRYPRFAYKFCTVDGETVTPISDAYGTVPTTAATGVLAETTATVPDGATHVFFGLLYSNGYTENATYDMVYKVDKG